MRFVCLLLALVFTLLSSVEIFGGPFVLYRCLNVLTLMCLWFACRKPSDEVASVETVFENIDVDMFDDVELVDDMELVEVESTEFSDVELDEFAQQLPCV
tara:strand:- start:3270 stop:3569 length:300 start_codon:yes stop_codon:yes gene_type:complete